MKIPLHNCFQLVQGDFPCLSSDVSQSEVIHPDGNECSLDEWGRNHSATTFTVKEAVISGCRATVAANSPVVLIGSTVMFFGLTAAWKTERWRSCRRKCHRTACRTRRPWQRFQRRSLDQTLGGNSLFAGGDGLGQTSALHGLNLSSSVLGPSKGEALRNQVVTSVTGLDGHDSPG